MVVYGGIHLLAEDDDDDLFGQRKSTDRVTAPTSVYLPPRRAWFSPVSYTHLTLPTICSV